MDEDLKTEYEHLRAEIERRSTVQQALFVLNLTAVGAITDIALKSGLHNGVRAYYLVLLIPYVSFALARLWLDHHNAIANLGSYIRTSIERRSTASWETAQRARFQQSATFGHYLFFVAYSVVFVGPGVAALGATWNLRSGTKSQVMWFSALLFLAANVFGWARACWPKAVHRSSFTRTRMIFEPRVRTMLAWETLAELPNVSVHEFFVDEDGPFDGWFFPWYVDSEGFEVGVREGGAPISLVECGKLPDARTRAVDSFASWFEAAPRKFEICIYKLSGDNRLVLDGNHRLAAGLRSGLSFAVRVFEIEGPIDPKVLPDLAHWQSRGREGSTR